MFRILFFLITLVIPILFGWWLFLPLLLVYIYLAKLPYEVVILAVILDSIYYFGNGFFAYRLTIISIISIIGAYILNTMLVWNKRI